MSQMHAHAVPVAGQPWMSSGNQSVAPIPPVHQTGQQPSVISSTDSVIFFVIIFYSFLIHSNHFITKITMVMSFLHAFLFDVST